MESTPLRALALVCTLNPSPARSSSQLLAEKVMDALCGHGVEGEVVRIVDHDVRPCVQVDMGEGDAWPGIREETLAADIVVLSTPIWLGHPSSVAQRVLERRDGEPSESDDEGRMLTYGKAAVCVVGNEDGAHHVSAELFQGLNDVGPSPLAPSHTGSAKPCRAPTTRTSPAPRIGRVHHEDPRRQQRPPGPPPAQRSLPRFLTRSVGPPFSLAQADAPALVYNADSTWGDRTLIMVFVQRICRSVCGWQSETTPNRSWSLVACAACPSISQ